MQDVVEKSFGKYGKYTTSPRQSESRILQCVFLVQCLTNVIKKKTIFSYPLYYYYYYIYYSVILYSTPEKKTDVEQMADILQYVDITYFETLIAVSQNRAPQNMFWDSCQLRT